MQLRAHGGRRPREPDQYEVRFEGSSKDQPIELSENSWDHCSGWGKLGGVVAGNTLLPL